MKTRKDQQTKPQSETPAGRGATPERESNGGPASAPGPRDEWRDPDDPGEFDDIDAGGEVRDAKQPPATSRDANRWGDGDIQEGGEISTERAFEDSRTASPRR